MKTVPVTQYYNGKPVASYASMVIAANLTGARANHISEVANGVRQTAGGYSWKRGSRKGQIVALDGNTPVATFSSLDAVRTATRVRADYVNQALNGKRKTVNGYTWTR